MSSTRVESRAGLVISSHYPSRKRLELHTRKNLELHSNGSLVRMVPPDPYLSVRRTQPPTNTRCPFTVRRTVVRMKGDCPPFSTYPWNRVQDISAARRSRHPFHLPNLSLITWWTRDRHPIPSQKDCTF